MSTLYKEKGPRGRATRLVFIAAVVYGAAPRLLTGLSPPPRLANVDRLESPGGLVLDDGPRFSQHGLVAN
jgi:hypothetical protein